MYCAFVQSLGIVAVVAVSPACWAGLIAVNLDGAFVPGGGEQPLPIYVANQQPNPDSVRFRFSVPDAAHIESLNSVGVFVDVYDDDDNQDNEAGSVVFSLNAIGESNLVVATFEAGLNGSTADTAVVVGDYVPPANFTDVLAEIQNDEIFFIRLNRTGGDYFVKSGTVLIDANLIPEPGSMALLAIALLFGESQRRKARRRPVRL